MQSGQIENTSTNNRLIIMNYTIDKYYYNDSIFFSISLKQFELTVLIESKL